MNQNHSEAEPTGPLAGVRVIELGSIIAGPFAGRMLADLGADLIKVEGPGRLDPMRDWGQGTHNGRKLWWPTISRNKRLITLDLASERGRELLLELAASADAIVENFKPGTLEKLGLGYERLREANRRLVLVRISGYGQTGPYAARPGFAAAAEALAGLRAVNGYPGEIPPRMGISFGDSVASLFAVQGLLAALLRRGDYGDGEVVDVSIVESCLALTESMAAEYDMLGVLRQPAGARLDGIAPSAVFRSKDGKLVVIAANQDALYQRLCAAIGRDDLASDPRFQTHDGRGEHQDLLEAEIQKWASQHTATEIDEILAAAGVVSAPIATMAELFADPHVQARGMLAEHDDPEIGTFRSPGVVPLFSGGSSGVRWSGRWEAGADNEAVFGELGHDDGELERLREEKVI